MNEKRKQVLEQLYKLIKEGEILTDDKLPTEKELIEITGIPRQILRDALIILESFGILEIRERQGIFLINSGLKNITKSLDLFSGWPADVIPQVFEMRLIIEPASAQFAAKKRNDVDILKMDQCIEALTKLHNENHPSKGILGLSWNSMLHKVIVDSAHNNIISRVYEGVSGVSERAINSLDTYYSALPFQKWPDLILEEHIKVVEAIKNKDSEKAYNVLTEHLKSSALRLNEIYAIPELKMFYGDYIH